MQAMILYDLANKDDTCWSPNTFGPRPVLAYKKIAYETRWISYPDVEKELRGHGQESAETVTVPVLIDGGRYIHDSWEIAKYLEEKVPQPSIFANGIEAQEKFLGYVRTEVQKVVLCWIMHQIPPLLDVRGAEYFRRTREAKWGKSLEEVSSGGDDEYLPRLRGGATPIFHALRKSGAFIMGAEFSYADCAVLGTCQWLKQADPQKLKKFLALDTDGHFAQWYQRCGQYNQQMN